MHPVLNHPVNIAMNHIGGDKSGDVAAGEIIIRESAYASVLISDFEASHCHHCFVGLTHLSGTCHYGCGVLYCSPECLDESWFAYHQFECQGHEVYNYHYLFRVRFLNRRLLLLLLTYFPV